VPAAIVDVTIYPAADLVLACTLTRAGAPWDLSTATIEANLYPFGANGVPCMDAPVALTIAEGTDGYDLGALTLSLTAAQTAALTLPAMRNATAVPRWGIWRLHITDVGATERILEGRVSIDLGRPTP
jgi:hypothetical protein